MKKTIRKTLLCLLALMLAVVLSGCTIRLSTTNTIMQNPFEALVVEEAPPEPEKTYEELTLEEKMEYKSVINLIKATDYSTELLAPALDPQSELWGYINLQGEWIIAPQFKAAGPFYGNIAKVEDNYGDPVVINRQGEVVLETYAMSPLSFVGRANEDGILNIGVKVTSDQTYTYVNSEGAEAFSAWNVPFTLGGSYAAPELFELATPFREGKAVVMRARNEALLSKEITYYVETAYIIDTTGFCTATLPEGTDADPAGFDDNMMIIIKTGEGKYGLADSDGNVVIDTIYDLISHCDGSMYLAQKDGKYGFIDKDGNTIIDFTYADALPFSEGLAAVNNGEGWGFIKETGEAVTEFAYDDVKAMNIPEYGDGTAKGAFSSGIAVVEKGRFWGLIDTNGEIILAVEAEECPVKAVCSGYISYEYNGSCGVFTVDGRYVLLPAYGSVGEFR